MTILTTLTSYPPLPRLPRRAPRSALGPRLRFGLGFSRPPLSLCHVVTSLPARAQHRQLGSAHVNVGLAPLRFQRPTRVRRRGRLDNLRLKAVALARPTGGRSPTRAQPGAAVPHRWARSDLALVGASRSDGARARVSGSDTTLRTGVTNSVGPCVSSSSPKRWSPGARLVGGSRPPRPGPNACPRL